MNRFSEKDWKLFRKKLPDWQEVYVDNKKFLLVRFYECQERIY